MLLLLLLFLMMIVVVFDDDDDDDDDDVKTLGNVKLISCFNLLTKDKYSLFIVLF